MARQVPTVQAIRWCRLLFYIGSNLADERIEATASLAIVLTVATAFAYMGTAEGIVAFYFGLKHPRELLSYLLLGLLSVSAGFYLALSRDESLQRVALIVAPHTFLFGFAQLRIAQYMDQHPKQRDDLAALFTPFEIDSNNWLVDAFVAHDKRDDDSIANPDRLFKLDILFQTIVPGPSMTVPRRAEIIGSRSRSPQTPCTISSKSRTSLFLWKSSNYSSGFDAA